ncbi:extracellular solute-binding protein [Candidatus Berkelbacteria bacterium]|nr:extracellular solute-binding protein [Candidatus Berkelbacteria bacterium]
MKFGGETTNKRWLKSAAVAAVAAIFLTGCQPQAQDTIGGTGTDGVQTISIWRTFDSIEAFQETIDEFERDNPNIQIDYRELPFNEYELYTSEALAAGEGPDIWSIRNDWLPRHQNKLIPMPEGLLKENNDDLRPNTEILQNLFVPIVSNDVVIDGQIYGLPYYVDSLVIYRNEDIFRKKISQFRSEDRDDDADFLSEKFNTYDKLQRAVQLLTEKSGDNINLAGIAAGTSNNVDVAQDVVYAMMLQNGTEMVSPNLTNASFHLGQAGSAGQTVFLGTEALQRFTSFADPNQPHYSWNANMPSDIQAFIEGKAAMMFGYQYHELIFDQIAPTLKFSAQPLPQIRDEDTPIDYGSYWVETVTKNAANPDLTWQILDNLVRSRGSQFRSATGRPDPRLIGEIPTTIDRNEKSSPHNFQQQTAIDWYKTKRPDKVDQIFKELIQQVGTKKQSPQNAIEEAAQQVTTILQDPSR